MKVSVVNSAGGSFCWNYATDTFYSNYAGANVCCSYAGFDVLLELCWWYFLRHLCRWIVTLPTMPILLRILYRPPDKPDFIKHINNVFTETGILDKQECYLLGD